MKETIFFLKRLKNKEKELALSLFYYLSREIRLGHSWKLACIDQSRFFNFSNFQKVIIIHKSELMNIFNNMLPARWVAHITRDFLTCHSCLHYSSMADFTSPYQINRNHATKLSTFDHVTSERYWQSTLGYTENVNNYRLKRETVCQIVRSISHFSLELYIQFWKLFHSMILGSVGRTIC